MTCGGGEVPGCSMNPKQHHIACLGVGKNMAMIDVDPGIHAASRCCQDAGSYNTRTYVCRVEAVVHMVSSRVRFARYLSTCLLANQVRAAYDTSKLSSSIWKRVTILLVIVKMIAN